MKFLKYTIIITALLIVLEGFLYGANRGKVISTESNRLFVANGEKVIIDIGEKEGVLKGDILKLVKTRQFGGNVVGECIAVKTSKARTICEIVKTSIEIETGDAVLYEKIEWTDETIGSMLISLLKNILDPYKPDASLLIYLAGIYDNENRRTLFSHLIEKEIGNLAWNKGQLKLVERGEAEKLKEMILYPESYFKLGTDFFYPEEMERLKTVMKMSNIDVVVMGSYTVENESISISLYYIDRNFGEKRIVHRLPKSKYLDHLTQVIEPYRPLKPKKHQQARISYKKVHFFPSSYEQKEIAEREAKLDVDFRYTILEKKIRFNRISPGNVEIKLNGKLVKLAENEEAVFYLEEGTHVIGASFHPIFYQGTDMLYASKRKIGKEIALVVKEQEITDPVDIEITLECGFERDDLRFKVYRKIDVTPKIVKPIETVRERKGVFEVYTD
ncbi:MAG: hypothetical protein N2513_07935 [Deltaproteobacteria bacterium]|nr:hypothetical protein [Deltaproteobacteria bacterium]